MYENSELKAFKIINFLGKISNNLLNDSLGTNVYETLKSCRKSLLTTLQ